MSDTAVVVIAVHHRILRCAVGIPDVLITTCRRLTLSHTAVVVVIVCIIALLAATVGAPYGRRHRTRLSKCLTPSGQLSALSPSPSSHVSPPPSYSRDSHAAGRTLTALNTAITVRGIAIIALFSATIGIPKIGIPTGCRLALRDAAIVVRAVAVIAFFVAWIVYREVISKHAVPAAGDDTCIEAGVAVVVIVAFFNIGPLKPIAAIRGHTAVEARPALLKLPSSQTS